MQFDLNESIEMLERTPYILNTMLKDLPKPWVICNEGKGTWCAFDVVGHLIDGEMHAWMVRVEMILNGQCDQTFKPFDRFKHIQRNKERTLEQLLEEFHQLRETNVHRLRSAVDSKTNFTMTGIHPEYGEVTLAQLLSTWVVHDLDHISQISRVMANRYCEDVGPWKSYLKILSS